MQAAIFITLALLLVVFSCMIFALLAIAHDADELERQIMEDRDGRDTDN